MDLVDAYLDRLGLARPDGPASLETLRRLHERHLERIPFENLDIERAVPIVLDEAAIVDKLVRRRRGGFCYELNGGLAWLLEGLGFRVGRLAAEVARPEGGFGIPFDHMALRVDLPEGTFLADVGFGDGFRRPLPLREGETVDPMGDVFALRRSGSYWLLERGAPGAPGRPQYRFRTETHRLDAFAPGCTYHQTSPASTFTRGPLCTRATPEGRVTLTADRLTRTDRTGKTVRPVASRQEWRALLAAEFGIVLGPAR